METFDVAERQEIGHMSDLTTPPKLRKLQRTFYRKAKDEPQFRFYALFDKVCREETLWHAWDVVRRNGGAPGVDGVTIEQIEERGEQEWIEELRGKLVDKQYQASPVRRVEIPKPGGGTRPLGIPTVEDRVVQMAVKLVIEPIFEADFEDEAYGYRPERSAKEAVQEVHEHLTEGRTDVVDADLSSYFDTIPHDQLIESVRRRISDGTILKLIKMWLEAPVVDEDDDGTRRVEPSGQEGTPQGGIVSPLLANIYMNRFLKFWSQQNLDEKLDARIVNYADDFVILTRGNAEEALHITRWFMEAVGLKLNEQKTEIRDVADEDLEFLGYEFGWEHHRKDGHTYLAAQPAPSRRKRLKRKVRRWLKRNVSRPWEIVRKKLNDMLEGWANYFSYGTRTLAYREIDNYVYERVRAFLVDRHGLKGRGTDKWPDDTVFGELGVMRLRDAQYGRV